MNAEAGPAGRQPPGADEAGPVLVSIAAPDGETALRLARLLVEERLAACAQVIDPVRSVYRWKGEVQEEPEALLLAKSCQDRVPRIHELLRREHPYELPELVSVPITGGSPEYLRWLRESLG